MNFIRDLKTMLSPSRKYTLGDLHGGLIVLMTMFAAAQAWFWGKHTLTFGELFVAEYDKFGPFYWQALYNFVLLSAMGFLTLAWGMIAKHLQQHLSHRMFANAR